MDHDMALRLLGDADQMDPRALQRALGALLDVLDGPRGKGSPRGAFVVSDLKRSSLAFAVKPREADPVAARSIERAWTGIEDLSTMAGMPASWDRFMVKRLIGLCDVTSMRGVESAELSSAGRALMHVDENVRHHAEESLTVHHSSLGSVRGQLDRWLHRGKRREVGLVDEVTNRAITVQVSHHLEERVLAALQRTVLAWGVVERNPAGDKIGLLMEDFEVVEDAAGPSTESMAGFLGDWTGGRGSVEWVRAQRAG